MTKFLHRLAGAVATASVALAAVAIASPAVSSAGCDPAWSRDFLSGECHPQPAPPDWYTVRPAYAPPNAPVDVPPPPPPPPWAGQMQPRWDEGGQHWIWVGI